VQVVANGAHHHLARVEAHADLHLHAVPAAQLRTVAPQGVLHGERSVTGTHGVVLMGHGGPKQGHDAIAEHLIHRAFEAVYGVHHKMEGGIEELLGGFGIEPPDEFGGVFEIGKQDGHLFALPFQGTAGHENLFCEIGGRVGERRER